jgi:hypothetical protein
MSNDDLIPAPATKQNKSLSIWEPRTPAAMIDLTNEQKNKR